MAKAILCGLGPDKATFTVITVYPDGTDLTKLPNPATGQLLIRVSGDWWSVNDNVATDVICNGVAAAIAGSTINWTQVKAAIN